MKKKKVFAKTRFSADVLEEALAQFERRLKDRREKCDRLRLSVEHADAEWSYDNKEEFFADYRRNDGWANLNVWSASLDLDVRVERRQVVVVVGAPNREEIEGLFAVFEKHADASRLPDLPLTNEAKPVVFIGHGRSSQWRDLKDHLVDKHGVQVEAYETGARAGHSIRDILEDMSTKASFALLVMTAEDEQADGGFRARQNVVHEAGLFQGKLGFARAIVMLEEGAQDLSNFAGVQQIRFSKDNIKETFGEVLATLRREFS